VGGVFIVLQQVALEDALVGVFALEEAQAFEPGVVDVIADALHAPGGGVQPDAGRQQEQDEYEPGDGDRSCGHEKPLLGRPDDGILDRGCKNGVTLGKMAIVLDEQMFYNVQYGRTAAGTGGEIDALCRAYGAGAG